MFWGVGGKKNWGFGVFWGLRSRVGVQEGWVWGPRGAGWGVWGRGGRFGVKGIRFGVFVYGPGVHFGGVWGEEKLGSKRSRFGVQREQSWGVWSLGADLG